MERQYKKWFDDTMQALYAVRKAEICLEMAARYIEKMRNNLPSNCEMREYYVTADEREQGKIFAEMADGVHSLFDEDSDGNNQYEDARESFEELVEDAKDSLLVLAHELQSLTYDTSEDEDYEDVDDMLGKYLLSNWEKK